MDVRYPNKMELVQLVKDVPKAMMKASNGGKLDVHVDVDGTGRWEADGGKIQLNSNVDVTTTGDVSITNGGELELNNATMTGSDLFMDSTGTGILDINSTVSLSGDLSFAMTDESKWVWDTSAALEMTGGEEGPWSEWKYLEIGGEDKELNPLGFSNNFDLPNLFIDDSAHIYLADWINNGNRSSAEALYVDDLDVFTDAILNLNGLNLYTYYDSGSGSEIHLVLAGEGNLFGGGTIIDTPVPIPTTLFLLGSGLIGLVAVRRKKKTLGFTAEMQSTQNG